MEKSTAPREEVVEKSLRNLMLWIHWIELYGLLNCPSLPLITTFFVIQTYCFNVDALHTRQNTLTELKNNGNIHCTHFTHFKIDLKKGRLLCLRALSHAQTFALSSCRWMGRWKSNCFPCGSPEYSTEIQIKALTWLAFCQARGGTAPWLPSYLTHTYFVKINLLINSSWATCSMSAYDGATEP